MPAATSENWNDENVSAAASECALMFETPAAWLRRATVRRAPSGPFSDGPPVPATSRSVERLQKKTREASAIYLTQYGLS